MCYFLVLKMFEGKPKKLSVTIDPHTGMEPGNCSSYYLRDRKLERTPQKKK